MMTPLDHALEVAEKEQEKGNVFYNLFLNTDVFIPTHDAASLGQPRRSEAGESFHPVVIENNGIPYLPIFDTYDRLVKWSAEHQMSYVQMPAHALIRSSLDAKLHLALNVETSHVKIFVPEELKWLRKVYEAQIPKEFSVPAGTKVLVGAPATIPEGIEDSLRVCLKRNREVEAAFLGQVHFMIEGEKPQLFLVLKIDNEGKEFIKNIQEDIGVAMRSILQKGVNITLQIYDGNGVSSDIVKTVEPFYSRPC
jgi:hypothetical protein